MSHRGAWVIGVAALALGIGVGAAATYLLIRPRGPEPKAAEHPPQQEPGGALGAPGPPPRLEPAEVDADTVLTVCGFSPAKSYKLRGFNVAYYYVTESNSYSEGHSVVGSNSGIVSDGGRIIVAVANRPPPGGRKLICFLGAGTAGHGITLPQDEFVGGASTISSWAVEKPLELRVGQSATLCQFGSSDGRSGQSSERDLGFDRDPLADFRPLPRIGEGGNHVARMSVRVMRMDPTWTLDSPEVKQFLDFRRALQRAAGGRE
jgi:hypothetical protein